MLRARLVLLPAQHNNKISCQGTQTRRTICSTGPLTWSVTILSLPDATTDTHKEQVNHRHHTSPHLRPPPGLLMSLVCHFGLRCQWSNLCCLLWVTLSLHPTCIACTIRPIMVNMRSSTKPEVHNVLQCRQKKTGPGSEATLNRKFGVKFGHVVPDVCWRTGRRTDRQTHMLITILRSHTVSRSMWLWQTVK